MDHRGAASVQIPSSFFSRVNDWLMVGDASWGVVDATLTGVVGMPTTPCILRYGCWLEETSPGFLAGAILTETGEDYGKRDLLDQVARLIEIFGVAGVAEIVGCS